MQVTWVSNPGSYEKPYVIFGRYPTKLNLKTYAMISTYNVGHIGFFGKIYRATMRELEYNTKYYYMVGDEKTKTYSELKYFMSPPRRFEQRDQIRFATVGDVGTFAPFGHMTLDQISRDNLIKPFDFVWLTGDLAYAGMGSE